MYILNALLWVVFNFSLFPIMSLSFLFCKFNPVRSLLKTQKLTTKDKYYFLEISMEKKQNLLFEICVE